MAYTQRGAWETEILLLFLLLLLCKALFCCILLCAGALKLWLFSHPFVTSPHPLISFRLHNFQRIFAGFYFAWFTLIFQPPSPDVLPSSLSLLFTSNVTHSSSRLSLSLTLFACLSVCVCVRVQVYASCFARFCSFITHLTHKSNMCKCFHFICTLKHIKYFRCLLCIAHEASTRNRGKSSSSNITRAELSSRRSFSFLFVRVNEVEKRVKYATNSSRWLPCNTHSTSSLRHFTLTSLLLFLLLYSVWFRFFSYFCFWLLANPVWRVPDTLAGLVILFCVNIIGLTGRRPQCGRMGREMFEEFL